MPCYNELSTIEEIVSRVLAQPLTAELVVVDDGSTDGTRDILAGFTDPRIRVLLQETNQGKGAAIRRGFQEATADFVIVQDADLEYNPSDYDLMMEPLLDGRADVVFGSRFQSGRPRRVLYFWHSVGNRFLTLLSNMFTDLNLTDMETCYKMVRADLLQSLPLVSNRFGIEPELTARLARAGARMWEVPISYSGRTYAEGKKINWRDGVAALWHIFRFNLFTRHATISRSPNA